MRPINKGTHPQQDGQPVVYKKYEDARDQLFERIGEYCSYCEMQSNEGPAIEHVQPKKLYPNLKITWDNFLLGCRYCNSSKGTKDINLSDYFWPDKDNTFRAFVYERDRAPQISPVLSDPQKRIAQNTLELTGLDREPGHPQLTDKDRRWLKRRDAWGRALDAKNRLGEHPELRMREQIVDTAIQTGFWSVWMTVFADDADMRQRLLTSFPGTNLECFDQNIQPISHSSGLI